MKINTSERSPLSSTAPLTASDAIENELHRLYAAPTRTRSRLLCALEGLKKVSRFIIRPESMTAYATLAAAFAAFLAVKAAERQEKATFTSALLGKQVDVVATSITTLSKFLVSYGKYWIQSTVSEDDFNRIMVDDGKLSESMATLEIVYPKEAQPFISQLKSHEEGITFGINDIHREDVSARGVTDGKPPSTNSDLRKMFVDDVQKHFWDLMKFNLAPKTCSDAQLRQGKYIDGPTFQSCADAVLAKEGVKTK